MCIENRICSVSPISVLHYGMSGMRFNRSEDPLAPSVAKELRSKWCQCADELGEMIQETLRTDPRYERWKEMMNLDKKPDPRYNNSARVQEDEQSQT